jgi:hypothetical protein
MDVKAVLEVSDFMLSDLHVYVLAWRYFESKSYKAKKQPLSYMAIQALGDDMTPSQLRFESSVSRMEKALVFNYEGPMDRFSWLAEALGIKKPKAKIASNKSLFDRKADFANSVKEHQSKYPMKMLEEFIGWWSESNAKGVMRFEDQEFFEIGRRLATWAARNNKTVRNESY